MDYTRIGQERGWCEIPVEISLTPRVVDELTPGGEEPFELTDGSGQVIGAALVRYDVPNGLARVTRLRWDPALASEQEARQALARAFGSQAVD